MSIASHVAGFVLVLGVLARIPAGTLTQPADPPTVVWLTSKGLGNDGGGGGDNTPKPARRMEAPGTNRATVPVRPSPSPDTQRPSETPPPAAIAVPALPTASGIDQAVGVVSDLPGVPSGSLGSGRDGAGGPGTGGNGPASGRGLGPETGCCDVFTAGGIDITSPQLVREIRPTYTTEAMRARVQGVVVLEAVVMPDGSVGTVEILQSLDSRFGLDKEAVRTVKLWRFKPGTKSGRPVPVRVQIDLAFTLR